MGRREIQNTTLQGDCWRNIVYNGACHSTTVLNVYSLNVNQSARV